MRTFTHKCVAIHHNSDYSGQAIIQMFDQQIDIPCEALVEFAANILRNARIARTEQQTACELLELGEPTCPHCGKPESQCNVIG